MSQISKCPKLRVVLGYWEALGEVSELRYKNLLYSSSKRSYCILLLNVMTIILLLSMKGNGECVCENHGYTEPQCLEKGCCKFDHSVGKVPG